MLLSKNLDIISLITRSVQEYIASGGAINNQRIEVGGTIYKIRVVEDDSRFTVSVTVRGEVK